MTQEQTQLHARALRIARRYREDEAAVIRVLREVDRTKLFKAFGIRSLIQYAIQELGLAEPTAYMLIAVGRKADEIPALAEAIYAGTLSASKASRALPCMTRENAAEIIAFVRTHTSREIDVETARRNPKARRRDHAKPISGNEVEMRITFPRRLFEKLQHIEGLSGRPGSRRSRPPSISTSGTRIPC